MNQVVIFCDSNKEYHYSDIEELSKTVKYNDDEKKKVKFSEVENNSIKKDEKRRKLR
jgi:hypothetical protein